MVRTMTEENTDDQAVESVAAEEAVLVASDVSHAFGDIEVLDDVSLSVQPGTVTALIGPNGSGKTTLLRVLTGLLTPSEGEISYQGPDTAREIGYMPQQPAFRSGFSVRETLEFYTALADGDPAVLLDRVGLAAAGDRRVESLSGGMRRLLGIAQATVGSPPVVVLDEPGSGLDPGMRRHIYEAVGDLTTDGTAVLLSSHDMTFTEQFSDHVFALADQEIAASGSPADLIAEYDADSLQGVFERLLTGESSLVAVGGETE
jgi:ABC-type multidrug transport system ATPase subunit